MFRIISCITILTQKNRPVCRAVNIREGLRMELNKISGGDGRGKSYTFRSGEIYHHTPYFYEVMYDHSGDENSYVYVWRYRRNEESNKEYFAVKAIELASYYQYQ